jgi:hypothetical protein
MPPYPSLDELSDELLAEPFCTYCGRPPRGAWREPPLRVCSHCKLGMVLRTFPDAAPGSSEPFVIVDEQVMVQAISRHAETVLMVDEPAGVGVALDRFLLSDDDDRSGLVLARLVKLVTGGGAPAQAPALRTVGDPRIHFHARISACGPPLAALLVLKPMQAGETPSPNGRDAVGGSGSVPSGAP